MREETMSDCYEHQARVRLTDAQVDPGKKPRWLNESDYDVLVTGGRVVAADGTSDRHANIAVRKPNGCLLFVYRDNCLPRSLCKTAYEVFGHVKFNSLNRSSAAGTGDDEAASPSGIVGYFDRYPRADFCRQTAFNAENEAEFNKARPFIKAIDRVFAESVPRRYSNQLEVIRQTPPDFYISDTAFTTITVNRNWRTAQHKDKGDFAPGFGVMSVLEAGHYEGGYLVFPQYRVAVDLRTGGVCLADVHEWHGNTEIIGTPGSYVRLSMVFYYRAKMALCGTAAEELARAKRVHG